MQAGDTCIYLEIFEYITLVIVILQSIAARLQ
jgi:hypothetical protein